MTTIADSGRGTPQGAEGHSSRQTGPLAARFGDWFRLDGWRLAILVLGPILIGLLHDGWLYSPVGFSDPYFNVGFFLHYFNPDFLPGMYKEARVPWLAPGYMAYHLFGPMAANFILHVGCLVASAALVYLAMARVATRDAALLAALLVCTSYQFGGGNSGGWDYQTTPSGLFYPLTLYLLIRAAQTEYPRFWLAAAGMAFGAMVHSNIILVNLTLGLAAIYLVAVRFSPTLVEVFKSILWALFGFVLINLIFSVTAWDSGRDPVFFRSMFNMAASYTVDPATNQLRWWKPWSSGWFLNPIYLVYLLPLAAVFVASVAWIWARIRRALRRTPEALDGNGPARFVLVAQYVFAVLLWLFWQTQGQTALQPDYYAHPLIIPAVMALTVIVGPVGRRELIALGAILVAVMLSQALLMDASDSLAASRFAAALVTAVFIAAIGVGCLKAPMRGLAALAAVGVYMAAYPAMALTHQSQQRLWTEWLTPRQGCITPRLYFAQTVRLNALAGQLQAKGGRVWMWDGPDDTFKDGGCGVPVEYFRTTLVGTGVTALGAYHAAAAQMDDSEVRAAQYGDHMVAIVNDRAAAADLVARFKRSNLDLTEESAEKISLGRANAWVVVFLVS